MKLDETMLTAYDRERIERYKLIRAVQLVAEVKTYAIKRINETVQKRVN